MDSRLGPRDAVTCAEMVNRWLMEKGEHRGVL